MLFKFEWGRKLVGRSFGVSTHGGDRKPQSMLADTEQSEPKSFVLFEFYANSFSIEYV